MKNSFLFRNSAAVANYGGAMEGDTISKYGRKTKSQTSRGKFLRNIFFSLIAASVTFLSSCSSPEKDGIKAAKSMHQCQDDRNKKYIAVRREYNKDLESFCKKFESYSFKTRVEAREKFSEYIEKTSQSLEKIETDYQECIKNAGEYRNNLRDKYSTNQEKVNQFNYAYNNYQPQENDVPNEDYVDYHSKINDLILKIIPPKPNLDRVRNDLIGQTFDNQTAGYASRTINSSDELKDIEIQSTDKGDEYLITLHLPLKGVVNQFEANANMKYVLGRRDDWYLQTFEGKMNIVPTGKYKACIKAQWSGRFLIEFTNDCNFDLVVGGFLDKKIRFHTVIRSNQKFKVSPSTLMKNYQFVLPPIISQFEIDFVERAETSQQSSTTTTSTIPTTTTTQGIPGRFPQASERLLTASDVQNLSKNDLKIMRNEIFARHGYIFQSDDMKRHFNNQAWYTPKHKDVSSMLSNIETKNIEFIKRYE